MITRPDSPYKGLIPYQEQDAPFFFGRDSARQIICANLLRSRMTVLYGPSGAGKSSLLLAGVLPKLRVVAQDRLNRVHQGAHQTEVLDSSLPPLTSAVALIARPLDSKAIIAIHRKWDSSPVADVASCVADAAAREGVQVDSSKGLVACLEELTERGCHVYLILDQFEEYFVYQADADFEGLFADQLAESVINESIRCNFMLSLREDWLARLDFFKGTIPAILANTLRLEHLSRTAAREAILRPLAVFNASFTPKVEVEGEDVSLWHPDHGDFSVLPEEGPFVQRLLDELQEMGQQVGLVEQGIGTFPGSQEGLAEIQTPFLQLVLTRLWKEAVQTDMCMDRGDLNSTVGQEGAESRSTEIVQEHINEVMDQLSHGKQLVASRIFKYMVTPSGTKIGQDAGDLADNEGLTPEIVCAVLDELASKEHSIVARVSPLPRKQRGRRSREAEARFEVLHDVLTHAILTWRTEFEQHEAAEKARLAAERERIEEARQKEVDYKLQLAEADRERASEQEKRAEAERERADAEKRRAEDQAKLAESERARAAQKEKFGSRVRNIAVLLALAALSSTIFAAIAIDARSIAQRNELLANESRVVAEQNAERADEEAERAQESLDRIRLLNAEVLLQRERAEGKARDAEAQTEIANLRGQLLTASLEKERDLRRGLQTEIERRMQADADAKEARSDLHYKSAVYDIFTATQAIEDRDWSRAESLIKQGFESLYLSGRDVQVAEATFASSLSDAYAKVENWGKAVQYQRVNLEYEKKKHGYPQEMHSHVASGYHQLGYLLSKQGLLAEALTEFERSLEIYSKLDPKGADVADEHEAIALILVEQDKHAEALDHAVRAYEVRALQKDARLRDKPTALVILVETLTELDRPQDALRFADELVSRLESLDRPGELAASLELRAAVHRLMGDESKANADEARAEELREAAPASEPPRAN